MTTVTEAAKRIGLEAHSLESADLAALKSDPALAQQFARALQERARELLPAASVSIEDLRDILEVAVQGASSASRIVEGRYLRKRVRELCAYSDRYTETFAMVVLHLAPEPTPGAYALAMERVVEKLRRSDMVTVYRRRIAMLLPRMTRAALEPLASRVRDRLDAETGQPVVVEVSHVVYPSDGHGETQSVLDWLEDRLRID
jgi:hypothetical protein